MISFYMQSPSGFNVEFGCNGLMIDDDTWVVSEWSGRGEIWVTPASSWTTSPRRRRSDRARSVERLERVVNICILGAGGLGSVLGGWLADAGVDVTLVACPCMLTPTASTGCASRGFRGEATVGPEHLTVVTHPDEVTGDVDYLILLVKAKDTEQALADAVSLRDRTGVVLSLQNTVCKDEQLAEWIGADRVIGATTTEAGVLVEAGAVRYVATVPTSCYFGEVGGGSSPWVDALVYAFRAPAGFGSKAAADVEHVEWEKLLQI